MTSRKIRYEKIGVAACAAITALLCMPMGFPRADADEPAAAGDTPITIAEVKHEGPVDFEREILPLLNKNCVACHNRGKAESELVLETPQTILKGGASGPSVVAGKSAESLLLQVGAHTSEPFMPPADNKVGAKSFTPDELGLIKLWIDQGATGEVRGGADKISWQPLPPGVNPILAVALSDDGQYAACGRANQIFIYHVPSARQICRLTDPSLVDGKIYTQPGVAHHDLVQSLAFSPDGFKLASGSYREVKLWKRPNSVRLRETPTSAGAITASATSPDGKWLATAGQDAAIRLWDLATGQPGAVLSNHDGQVTAISFSTDGTKIFSAGRDQSIRSWDIASAKQSARINIPGTVLSLTVTGESNQIVTGSEDGLVRLWAMPDTPYKHLAGLPWAPAALAVSPDDKFIAVGLADGNTQIIDSASGQVTATLSSLGHSPNAIAYSSDGKLLAAAAGRRVTISDVATSTHLLSFEIESPTATRVAFAPQQARLAVGEFNGAVSVWDFDVAAKTSAKRGVSAPGGQPITGLCYSPDATMIYAVAADGGLASFAVALDKPVYAVRPGGPTQALAISPDGRWLALAGSDGIVRLVRAADGVAGDAPTPASHGAAIEQLTYSRDGRRLVAVTQNQQILVFDFVAAPKAQVYLTERVVPGNGVVTAAAFLGNTVLELGDRALNIWPLASSSALAGHTQAVTSIAAVPAAKTLFTGSSDGTIRQWDLAKLTEVRKFELGGPVTAVGVRPDAKVIAATGAQSVTRLWKVEDGAQIAEIKNGFRARGTATRLAEQLAVYKQKAESLTAAVAAADKDLVDKVAAAKTAAEALPATETAAQEAMAKLDVATKAKATADQVAAEATAKVESITKTKADADKLATDAAALAALAVDAATKAQAALDAQTQANATLAAVALAAKSTADKRQDDTTLTAASASADKAVADAAPALEAAKTLLATLAKIRDEKSAVAKQTADEQAKLALALTDAQGAAKTASDAKAAAEKTLTEVTAATKTATDARDNAKRAVAETTRGVEAATAALPLAKTNLELATATRTQFEAEVAAANQAVAAAELPLRSLVFSPDGKSLAIGGDDQVVRTYDAESGRPYEEYSAAAGAVTTVAYAADGHLVSASADGTLRTWNQYPTWEIAKTLGPAGTPDAAAATGADSLLADRVLALAFSPDGKWLASGGGQPSRSGEIRLWNVADGTPGLALAEPHSDTVFGLAFSSDGRYLASAAADKFVKVFQITDGKLLRSFEGHTHHALSTSWKFDGRLLASGGADGVIKIWNFDTGEQERTIRGFNKEVTSVEFLGTGPMLLSASADHSVRLQNADDGKAVRNFGGETDFVYSAKVTPDGTTVVAGGQDSVLRVWNGADGKVVSDLPPPAAK